MQESSSLTIKVGIFVISALVLLIGFSLRVSEDQVEGKEVRLNAFFEDALGLEAGADVSLRGVRIGKVETLGFDPARKLVKAGLLISDQYPLPDDSLATAERSTLFGSPIVVIKYGASATMLRDGGEIKTDSLPSLNEMMANISDASAEAKDLMTSLNENQSRVIEKIEGVIEENRENIKATSDSFAKAGPKLEAIADRMEDVTKSMSEGKGTLGKLYKDEQLYTDIQKMAADAREVVDQVKSGEGTLSKLVYSDEMAKKAQDSFDKLGAAGDEIQSLLAEKRTDLEKLIDSLASVGPKVEEAVSDFKEISSKVNGKEGTLGLLVNDPSLYNDAKKAVNQVGESFENSEEQGVVRSFVGVLFGAII